MSEWKKERIDYAVTTYAGGTPNRSRDDYFGGDIPWISSGEVNQSFINKTKEYITLLGLENSSARWIPKGAVLLAMYGATAGQVAKLKIRATANQAVLALIPNEEIVDKDFLYHLLNIEKDKILFFAQGSGQPNLSKGLIDRYFILFPESTKTQITIAKILDTCDTVIEQTQSAIAKYKAIKQGLLHDLFTRGLNANGHLRPSYSETPELYKESELGMIPKEWDVKRLEEVTTKIGDGIHTTPTYIESSDYKFINGNNLVDGIINITNKTNSVSFEEYTKHKIDLNEKTVLMSINGTIGNLAYYRNESVILGKSAAYICCGNDVDVEYVYSYLGTTILLKYFTDELTGSTIQNLSLASIRNAPILFPKPVEQKMIVKMLNTFTNKIQIEETLLQKYQSIKRGLMGDLLEGKKEVKI